MKYKSSNYNYFVDDFKNFTVYNTRTGSILSGESHKMDFEQFINEPNSFMNHEYFDILHSSGIVIDEKCDELLELHELHNSIATKRLKITIAPTLNCNFICNYCFVDINKGEIKNQLLDGILHYIEQKCVEQSVEKCDIIWFGGEPLLVIEKVEYFMSKFKKLSEKYNFSSQSSIVTNGYFLSLDVFERLIENAILSIQVTLDGVSENHNKYRTQEDLKPTFDIIYNNLLRIHQEIKYDNFSIGIRSNFLEDNLESMENFIPMFLKDFKTDNRFSISFRPIIDFTGKSKNAIKTKREAREIESHLIKQLFYRNDSLNISRPMFSLLPNPLHRWCSATEKDNLIISYDGSIYKCDSCITDSSKKIGKINENGQISYNENKKQWTYSIFDECKVRCLNCKRLPICMGGCILEIIETGDFICHYTDEYIYSSLNYLNSLT